MHIAAIIQARMGSSRLPGKVMLPLRGGRVIDHVVARAAAIPGVDEVAVATSTELGEQPLVDHLTRVGVRVIRGPEHDCVRRYRIAADALAADAVVRITADCPLLDPEVSGQVVNRFVEAAGALDYVSNVVERTYPRGLDTEVLSVKALREADRDARRADHREHVTQFVWSQPHRFRLAGVSGEADHSSHRWTLDTPEDLALISRIFNALWQPGVPFGLDETLQLLVRHPDWVALNAQVEQKKLRG